MIYTVSTLPVVHPMMVRRFTPNANGWGHFRDKVMMIDGLNIQQEMDVEEVAIAEHRMPFDRDIIDQSYGVLEFTTDLMLRQPKTDMMFAFFTSARWRNHRWETPDENGDTMRWPPPDDPLLFIGNPYIIVGRAGGACEVYREPTYLIRSGTSLQYD